MSPGRTGSPQALTSVELTVCFRGMAAFRSLSIVWPHVYGRTPHIRTLDRTMLFGASSLLYAFFMLRCLLDTLTNALCPLLVAAPPIQSGGHGGDVGDEIGLQILFGLVRKHNLDTSALQFQQRDNLVEPKAHQPIFVFNHDDAHRALPEQGGQFRPALIQPGPHLRHDPAHRKPLAMAQVCKRSSCRTRSSFWSALDTLA